jgi:hypothetical protein
LIVGVGPAVGTELGVGVVPALAPPEGCVPWFCWTPGLVALWLWLGVTELLGVVVGDGVVDVLWPPRVVPVW